MVIINTSSGSSVPISLNAVWKSGLIRTGGEKRLTYPNQDAQQHNAQTDAPPNESFFRGQQRFIFHLLDFVGQFWL
jgi:hypothetical protein